MCKLCSTKYYWEVLCASFVVQSILSRFFCVNAPVSQASACKSFVRFKFLEQKVLL